MDLILEKVYLGGVFAAEDQDYLANYGIKYILCCAKEIPIPLFPEVYHYIYMWI